jgi:cytosine/adenosine deaminase-related metal-dependent hydrolase
VDGILAMVAGLAAECHRPADGLTIGVGPSGPQRCTDALLVGAMDLAERLGLPFHTHLLETRAQAATADRLYGRSMVQHLHALGLLRPRVSVAHAVWLEPADVDLLARGGVRVVTNPVSNLAVGSGIAPLLALRRAGVAIGLGTDGANAAGRQSVFEVMKLAAMLAKLQTRDFAGWPTALEVLEMATLGGARALGLDDRAGSLEPGKEADLLVLRRDATALTPLTDVAWQLVYGRPEEAIERVMVAGRVVVEGGRVRTVDEPGLLAEARERGGRLIEGYRREVDAIGRLHPALAAVLARAYGGPCGALAARWHGEAAGAGPA